MLFVVLVLDFLSVIGCLSVDSWASLCLLSPPRRWWLFGLLLLFELLPRSFSLSLLQFGSLSRSHMCYLLFVVVI